MELHGWGRHLRARGRVARPEYVSAVDFRGEPSVLARGMGRSYGDAAVLTDGLVVLTERLNRFLSFDERTGFLRAEAGTTIDEVIDTFAPRLVPFGDAGHEVRDARRLRRGGRARQEPSPRGRLRRARLGA